MPEGKAKTPRLDRDVLMSALRESRSAISVVIEDCEKNLWHACEVRRKIDEVIAALEKDAANEMRLYGLDT
jgi:hypothetical protein